MGLEGLVVAALAVLALAACMSGRVSLDVVGIMLLAVLVLTGVVSLEQALSGFGSGTVVTLAALYVIGDATSQTGALDFVAQLALRLGGHRTWLVTGALCLAAGLMSMFASDTAVVLVFLPIVLGIARERGIAASRLLIPVAYAALLGGTCTLIGSSVNLLTSGTAESLGLRPIGFFEMSGIGLPMLALGVPLTLLLARWLLPDRASLTTLLAAGPAREYVTEVVVRPASKLIGKTIERALAGLPARALFVVRDEEVQWPPIGKHVLAEGDALMLKVEFDRVADVTHRLGSEMISNSRVDPKALTYFELAVASRSRMLGRRVGDLQLWRDHEVVVVALLREGQHLRKRVSDLRLRPGDLLLVCGDETSRARLEASTDFYVLRAGPRQIVRRDLARRAIIVLCATLLTFVLAPVIGIEHRLQVPLVALLGAVAMVATGCLTARRAYRAIEFPILVFIAGALALGQAMQTKGVAEWIARGMLDGLMDHGPIFVVAGLVLVGTLLNQFTSPYAVAALLTPIAARVAADLGLADPAPFILAVAFAGSNAFASPLGHQVNLMVMGPGGYRYTDFLRIGLPLCLYYAACTTFGLALRLDG